VGYLQATARLARARLAIAAGEDAGADLEAILALRDHEAARVPDNMPWVALFQDAESTLAHLKGSGESGH